MAQEAQIAFKEQTQIVDAIAQHRQAFKTRAEGKTDVLLRIQTVIADHIRVHFTCTGNFKPLALARTARKSHIYFDAGFGEREVARTEANLEVFRFKEATQRILIVSDEEFLRDVIRLSLADMQADVRCASDVPEMQRLVRRMLFDLVVVVGTSAFFTGCDVVRTLRPAGLGRPLVYVVAWQQAEQTVLSLLECGVDQYMTFPVSLQRLRTKIANALNRQL